MFLVMSHKVQMWFHDGQLQNDKGKKNFSDGGDGLYRVMVSYGNGACDDGILFFFS
jgi:hypothetical protein